jgi:hypothetical protein
MQSDVHKKSPTVDSSSSPPLEMSPGKKAKTTASVLEATLLRSTLKLIKTQFTLWPNKMVPKSGSVTTTQSSVPKTSHGLMEPALTTTTVGTQVNQTTQVVRVAPFCTHITPIGTTGAATTAPDLFASWNLLLNSMKSSNRITA